MPDVQSPSLNSASDTSLRSALAYLSAISLTVAGCIVFLPAGVLLVLTHSEVGTFETGIYTVLLAIWLIGLAPFAQAQRAIIQTAASLVLLAAPLFLIPIESAQWLPVPFIAFAVTFGAAFSFRPRYALPVIVTSALLNWLIVLNPAPLVILSASEFLGGFIGPLFILITGPALSLLSRSWFEAAKRTDSSRELLESVVAKNYYTLEVQSAQSAVDRRIHETVLNTFHAIAAAGPSSNRANIQAACQHDLDQLGLEMRSTAPQFLSSVIADAIIASGVRSVQPSVTISNDIELPPQLAGAARDALVEALRNIELHAAATWAEIRVTEEGDSLFIRVKDNGRGMSSQDLERFGLRNTIRASMTALGGSAEVDPPGGGGTTLTLSFPLTTRAALELPSEPSLESVTRSLLARICIISPSIFGFVTIWALTPQLTPSWPTLIAFLIFFAFNIALAIFWSSPRRVALAVATFVMAGITLLVAYTSLDGCNSSSAVHWLINSITGGIVLTIFALAGNRLRLFVLPALTFLGIFLIWGLPNDCRGVPAMSIFVTIAYTLGGMYTAGRLFKQFDIKRQDAEVLWARAAEQQAELAKQTATTASWSRVSDGARSLLAGIASGVIDPLAPSTRARAAAEESRIRVTLGFADMAPSAMWNAIQSMVADAGAAGISVDAAALSAARRTDPLPNFISEALRITALAYPGEQVTVRLFTDGDSEEILLTAPGDQALPIWITGESSTFATTEFSIGDCAVSVAVEPDMNGGCELTVNIRRPLNSPA
jgi:signal transduction histidine kinase